MSWCTQQSFSTYPAAVTIIRPMFDTGKGPTPVTSCFAERSYSQKKGLSLKNANHVMDSLDWQIDLGATPSMCVTFVYICTWHFIHHVITYKTYTCHNMPLDSSHSFLCTSVKSGGWRLKRHSYWAIGHCQDDFPYQKIMIFHQIAWKNYRVWIHWQMFLWNHLFCQVGI